MLCLLALHLKEMEHSVTGGAATALSSLAVDPQERERIDAICTWVRRQGEAPGAVDQIAARLAAGDPATSIGELQLADLTVQHTVHLLSQARQVSDRTGPTRSFIEGSRGGRTL